MAAQSDPAPQHSPRPIPAPSGLRAILTPYRFYLYTVGFTGLFLAATSLLRLPDGADGLNLLLLLLLAVTASVTTTSVPELTFEIGSAVSAAAFPLYGPLAAAFIAAAAAGAAWIAQGRRTFWRQSWEQLLFNVGMQSVAVFIAGFFFTRVVGDLDSASPLLIVGVWLISTVIFDQLNFWLLMGIIRFKEGGAFRALPVWRENRWAMSINIALIAFGGGLLSYAARQFGWSGIAIFFLPVALSAYAFRLYVSKMQKHMNNLENIVAARTRELKELMREKDAFLAVLTHDMKTPLTSIGLYAHLISKHPELLVQKPHMSEVILRSQQTLLNIVNNILDLEKLQAGGEMPMNIEHLDLLPLIEGTVETLRGLAVEKHLDLRVETGLDPLLTHADRQQIERVLANLISNAIKYTPDEGRVLVEATHDEEKIIVAVRDTGYGIPEAELPYVFDRYRRVDKHKMKAAGTGLGLAIAKAIVEAHGGTLRVASSEGEGSTFSFALPLQPQPDPALLPR